MSSAGSAVEERLRHTGQGLATASAFDVPTSKGKLKQGDALAMKCLEMPASCQHSQSIFH